MLADAIRVQFSATIRLSVFSFLVYICVIFYAYRQVKPSGL